jgi:hypothetical protein
MCECGKNAELLYVTTDNIFGYHRALKLSLAALMLKIMKIIRDRKEGRKYMTDEDAK